MSEDLGILDVNSGFGACETVTIEGKNGPVRINKADYDKAKHKPAKEASAPVKEPAKGKDK